MLGGLEEMKVRGRSADEDERPFIENGCRVGSVKAATATLN
jgi:hypothetical protein